MRVQHPLAEPVLTVLNHALQLAFARECQNWQMCHWYPILFSEESRLPLVTYDRCERILRHLVKCYAAVNIMTDLTVGQ